MKSNAINPKPPQPLSVETIMPIMPPSANQNAPFATLPGPQYPVNPTAPPYPTNQNIPYLANQRAPYPTN